MRALIVLVGVLSVVNTAVTVYMADSRPVDIAFALRKGCHESLARVNDESQREPGSYVHLLRYHTLHDQCRVYDNLSNAITRPERLHAWLEAEDKAYIKRLDAEQARPNTPN